LREQVISIQKQWFEELSWARTELTQCQRENAESRAQADDEHTFYLKQKEDQYQKLEGKVLVFVLDASGQVQSVSGLEGIMDSNQALQSARARVTLARKAASDTVVRAPFTGLVAERLVSAGDYVTRGMKVAQVVRITPLRIELTVPEQFVADVTVGQPVSFSVDAFPGRTFDGKVGYVSPSLRADQRALTVEAIVPNSNGELKPGMFATALIQQPKRVQAVMVPSVAVRVLAGTSRVFVIAGDHVDERIVTTGQTLDPLVEITTGLKSGERVATENVTQLVDGSKIK